MSQNERDAMKTGTMKRKSSPIANKENTNILQKRAVSKATVVIESDDEISAMKSRRNVNRNKKIIEDSDESEVSESDSDFMVGADEDSI